MKKNTLTRATATLLFLFAFTNLLSAQTATEAWTAKSAKQWVKSKEWANGFKAMPYKTTDCVQFAVQYHKNKPMWDKVFKFLSDSDLVNMPTGKYPIDGDNCFVNVTDSKTKSPEVSKIESHKKYIDLQYIVTDCERMGLVSPEDATVSEPYNPKKDVAFYKSDKIKYHTSSGNIFFLLFPDNYHQASVWVKGENTVRKIVVKIGYIAD